MNNLGLKIKELRIEKELTQGELAKILGITQDSISLWEKGKRIPDTPYIAKLAAYFDVSTDYLLGLSDEYEGTGKSAPTAPAALPLDESELLRNYRALSYAGKARVAAYTDLLREQEEGAPAKISYRK